MCLYSQGQDVNCERPLLALPSVGLSLERHLGVVILSHKEAVSPSLAVMSLWPSLLVTACHLHCYLPYKHIKLPII